MPSEQDAEEFRPEKRLHSLSWLFIFLHHNRAILPLFVAVLVGARKEAYIGLTVVGALTVPVLLNALWLQFTMRYGFSESGLVIREGVFFQNVRTIDYTRIENVDTTRGIMHRLLGVAQVQIETSSGGKAEASIRVLGLQAVEELRAHIFEQRTQGQEAEGGAPAIAAEPPEELLLSLDAGELIRYGLIDNRGMVIVAAIVALLADSGIFKEENIEPILRSLPFLELPELGLMISIVLGVSFVLILTLAIRVLSIVMALVVFHDFRLSRKAGDLHSQYGLLTRISLTLRQRRIQVVHQKSSLLHRLFKRTSLQVDLAGGIAAAEGAGQNSGNKALREVWLAPVCLPSDAERLILSALPQVSLGQINWNGLAPRARARRFRQGVYTWAIVITAPAAWFLGWWAIGIFFAVLPLLWLNASLYVKTTAWALHDTFFIYKRGWLTRKISIVPLNRIQSVRLTESPFDRRYRMANLKADTAGASAPGRRFEIAFLDREVAGCLAVDLYRAAAAPLTQKSYTG